MTNMKVRINHLDISDSPFNKDNENTFIFENEEKTSQIVQELVYGNPTCFLVSGYRGAGKTSFIKKIEFDITNNSDIVFVYINLSSYTNFSFILRKIIRGIHLAFQDEKYKKLLNKLDEKTVKDLNLLFQRTFLNITNYFKESISKEKSIVSKLEFNLKNVFLIFLVFVSAINLKFDLIPLSSFGMDLLFFIISSILAVITYFNLEGLIVNKDAKNLGIDTIELYDDEIAEYHLITILKNIKENNIKIVFVIDELDKIENANNIELLITELKPIMLSGLASFLLITGQRLSYKYNLSHMIDDSIISSVFSRIIHVPLLSTTSFTKIFENLLSNKEDSNKELIQNYLNSLILSSNKIPRRFLNLIRKDIIWENEKSYIEINDEDLDAYKTDSILLSIIDKIEKNEISTEYGEAIKDFFISQLFIWSQRIKLKKEVNFTWDKIYMKNDESLSYLIDYLSQLDDLCTLLLDRMVEKGLLEIGEDENKEGTKIYKWIKDVVVKSEISDEENNRLIKSKFLEQFIDLEKFIRDIYVDLIDADINPRVTTIRKMLKELSIMGVLNKRWLENEKFIKLIDLRNRIVHGRDINIEDIDIAQEFRLTLAMFKSEIIEEYTFYVTKKHLTNYGYELSREEKFIKIPPSQTTFGLPSYFDFIAVHPKISETLIFFEIKYGIQSGSILESIKGKINDFNRLDFPKKHLVIFYYFKSGRLSYDKLKDDIDSFIENNFPQIRDMVSIYYTSEYRSDASSGRLTTYLDQIMDKINQQN